MSDPTEMPTSQEPLSGQPDSGLAAETRPIPSQAEGDEDTVDQDLVENEEK